MVLTQQGKLIAFMSRALRVCKQSWFTYAKETLAIFQAIWTWHPFFIQTNQCSLKYLLEQRITTQEQQKWVAKLLGYDYEILYKPGQKNYTTDALSRVVGSPSLDTLFAPQVELWEKKKKKRRLDILIWKKFARWQQKIQGFHIHGAVGWFSTKTKWLFT